jgi:outer membrane biosynthesis protein TonB
MPEAQRRQEASPRPPPSLLAKQFLADELPEALRPTRESHRLQIAVIWGGDRLVEVRDAVPGETFTIGPKNSSVNVFQNLHSAGPLPFVHSEKDGSQHLMLPESASPTVRRNGESVAVEALVRSGQAERVDLPVKGVRYQLGLNERAELKFGELQVVARYTRPEWFKNRPLRDRLDRSFIMMLAILGVSACGVVKVMYGVQKPEVALEELLGKNKTRLAVWGAVPAPPEKPKPEIKEAPSSAPLAKGPAGRMGDEGKPLTNAAARKADPGKKQEVQNKGLLGAFNRQESALANALGAEGFNDGLKNALNGVNTHAPLADSGGFGGLGVTGTRDGGGGNDRIGIGNINGDPNGRDPHGTRNGLSGGTFKKTDVPFSPAKLQGLDDGYREEVARVIRRHWNEIKYCYEKELQKNPNLDGKVAVGFDIGPTGTVTKSDVREATLESADAQNCILASVNRWVFPPPKAGVVTVNYPFLFSAAR